LILARSGEGTIGKVALVGEGVNAVFSDFTMRIGLTNYDPLFAYYYFRTDYFQYLIEIHKKGLGNNTNIFPIQLKEFPLLDVRPERQLEITMEIEAAFAAERQIYADIEAKEKEISRIIETVFR
jgi:type I restriction enzyme S subunit